MARKKYYNGEKKKSGMMSAGSSSFANMPQNVVHKEWPKANFGLNTDLDDTIKGIDEQMGADVAVMRKRLSKGKY